MFDHKPERRGTNCAKWDKMEQLFGVAPGDGLAMWVADMEFPPPPCVTDAVQKLLDHNVWGYPGSDASYRAAVADWMADRHGWTMDPAHMFTTDGLVNAVGLCLEAFTQPGDGIVLFTPVYHAFSRVIKASGREVVECELPQENGRYYLDFDRFSAQLTGRETMLILCSPHNPGGRVWTRDELEGVAEFARRHDLLLVSDEIHHDLVFGGARHIPMTLIDGIQDRLVMLTAPSKTFNLAAFHTGQVTIADRTLRKRFAAAMTRLAMSPQIFGMTATQAAYSAAGAAWLADLIAHLDGNRQLFDAAVNGIPGVRSMTLEATYLAWVDFNGTGMAPSEIKERVLGRARIAPNLGETFGTGGAGWLRFNLGTTRAEVEEAGARLQEAFADLQ